MERSRYRRRALGCRINISMKRRMSKLRSSYTFVMGAEFRAVLRIERGTASSFKLFRFQAFRHFCMTECCPEMVII